MVEETRELLKLIRWRSGVFYGLFGVDEASIDNCPSFE